MTREEEKKILKSIIFPLQLSENETKEVLKALGYTSEQLEQLENVVTISWKADYDRNGGWDAPIIKYLTINNKRVSQFLEGPKNSHVEVDKIKTQLELAEERRKTEQKKVEQGKKIEYKKKEKKLQMFRLNVALGSSNIFLVTSACENKLGGLSFGDAIKILEEIQTDIPLSINNIPEVKNSTFTFGYDYSIDGIHPKPVLLCSDAQIKIPLNPNGENISPETQKILFELIDRTITSGIDRAK